MSRLLERETSPPSYSYRADTLSPFVPRLLEKERERERNRGGGRTRTKEVFRAIFFRKKNRVRVFHERFSFLPFRRCCVDGVWIPPRPEPFLHDFSDSHSRGFTLSHSLFLLSPSVSSTTSAFLLPALDSSPNREYRHLLPTFFHAD